MSSESPKKRSRKREADDLDTSEHKKETQRLRAYSGTDQDGEHDKKRLRSSDDAKSPSEWRQEHHITVKTANSKDSVPDPFMTFTETPFAERLTRQLTNAGFTSPTAIQAQCWPIILQRHNVVSIAKTGSGKTLGFLLPSFHLHLSSSNNNNNMGRRTPFLLVLAPTRELSVQIMEEAIKFGRPLGLSSICCYGGASKYPQIAALERGVHCIIATPGRLNDLLEMKKADLSQIQFLVLDEADRMLDMGFEPQIRTIVQQLPTQRQTLLFSATWPREIQTLAHEFLQPAFSQINVGEVNALVANKDIEQTICMIPEMEKYDKLKEILSELLEKHQDDVVSKDRHVQVAGGGKKHAKVIVFVAKKISCHELANRLWDEGFAVDSLHGDRPQWERTKVMQAFKAGQLRMLIATDVAARGLDVKDVGVVINYDMPSGVNGVEDYVHRIGRTGRAGAKGLAYTFFTPTDKKLATQLVQVLKKAEQNIPPELQAMVRPPRSYRGGGGGRGYNMSRGGGGRGYMNGRGYMGGGGGSRGGYGRGYGGRGGGRGRGGYGGRGRGGRW